MRAKSTRQDVPAPTSGAGVGPDRGRPERAVYSPFSEFDFVRDALAGLGAYEFPEEKLITHAVRRLSLETLIDLVAEAIPPDEYPELPDDVVIDFMPVIYIARAYEWGEEE